MDNICEQFEIGKKRMSGYHNQGNRFAERNIRSIREIFCTSLLETNLPQLLWRKILPSVTFALNSSYSSATRCSPFVIIHGRKATLLSDLVMDLTSDAISSPTPKGYLKLRI